MLGNSEVDLQAALNFGIPFWKVGITDDDFDLNAQKVVDYFDRV
jgi:hypothetical protein